MKLVSEIIRLPSIILVLLAIITEVSLLIFIEVNYKKGYSILFEPTKSIAINKTNITSMKFNEIISNGLYRYYGDLKLIGRHMSTFILDGNFNANETINKNSNFFKNYKNSLNKLIIYSDFKNLSEDKNLKDFAINNFNYIEKYEKEFNETKDPNSIIESLLNNEKHPELNYISYYKYNGNIQSLTEESRISANYLISILKTIFIKRYLTKREEMDYLRINLLLKEEFYTYPPNLYNNTYIYRFPYFSKNKCDYNSNNVETQFPYCIYDYIKLFDNQLISFNYPHNEPFYLQSYINFNIVIIDFCMTINFVRKPDFNDHTYLPHICIEINITKLFDSADFENKSKVNLGVFAKYTFGNSELLPVFYSNKESYDLIKKTYSNGKFKQFQINLDNKSSTFSLFHFLYLDIFANESCYTEESANLDKIFEEYEQIYLEFLNRTKDITNDINRINYNFSIKYFEIEKTGCKSNLYNENVTVSKDKYLILLTPLICKFGFLDENFF